MLHCFVRVPSRTSDWLRLASGGVDDSCQGGGGETTSAEQHAGAVELQQGEPHNHHPYYRPKNITQPKLGRARRHQGPSERFKDENRCSTYFRFTLLICFSVPRALPAESCSMKGLPSIAALTLAWAWPLFSTPTSAHRMWISFFGGPSSCLPVVRYAHSGHQRPCFVSSSLRDVGATL